MFIIVVAPFTFIRQLLGTIMQKNKNKKNKDKYDRNVFCSIENFYLCLRDNF